MTRLFTNFLFVILTAVSFQVSAQEGGFGADLFSQEPQFLPVDEAFRFDFAQNGNELTLSWEIADGYYLYKKQFKTVVKKAKIGEPTFPEAEQVEDEYFGISDVFFHQADIQFPIFEAVDDSVVKIRYQGCAKAGLCYPPTTKVVYLSEVEASGEYASSTSTNADAEDSHSGSTSVESDETVSQQFELSNMLSNNDNLVVTLLLFLALGVGLAFTPCVFPMYPIISGIVLGQGKSSSARQTFSLSFVYVQGMALMYSILGLVVASAGVQFQAALQHPAILIVLIVVFALLALVMFGAYELQLPSSWQVKLNEISNKQKSGSYAGVFMMGAISGLVASPCTTAPLTGILLYIAQSGDLVLGFSALYALSLGMGIPLIAFAVTGGKLLPKAGGWMNIVKVTFGFMMLVVALVFVERMFSNLWTDLAWSLLGLAMFSYFYVMNSGSATSLWKGIRAFVIFLGLFASAMYGYKTLFPSTASVSHSSEGKASLYAEFDLVKNLADFEQKMQEANAEGRYVMIDLYADWCVACKEFEKYTFPEPDVQDALGNALLLQIDLTDNTPESLEFQEAFNVLGLPTIMFFDKQGKEIGKARVTGFMDAERFANHVNKTFYD
ncbi:protein-disulfide reductase DsbD [Alteromonas sp. a30]|uniref:protein-disulfide reductase DsbD n=1 Tax=Alteromonas sp. a30 TaxID=2730917 RepID=UPI002281D5C3|nr:protein-disulfide reductase DsbD [Alteromonas sp. a30]MCY7294687.1 protein-disulfide reductase DsbD [Alteromonas sp. a30]